jgi:hypothetical protein
METALFGLGKKAYRAISQYPDTWGVGRGVRAGRPVFVRYRSGLKDAAGHTGYPFQIGVAVPLADASREGLSNDEEAARLAKLEDALDDALKDKDEAVFAMAITTGGMREFVFYASEWKPEYFAEKVSRTGSEAGYKPQFMMRADRDWEAYRAFVR